MLGLQILLALLLLVVLVAPPLIPSRRRRTEVSGLPWVTLGLLGFCVFFFLVTSTNGSLQNEVARDWGLVPRHATFVGFVAHMFLHGNWGHLLANMLGLWLFGPHVEEALGRWEYLLFYLGCGFAAALLHVVIAATLMAPPVAGIPLVGASGAIFGVLGLFAVRFWRAKVRVFLVAEVPAAWAVGLFALLQAFFGLVSIANGGESDSTANWAHVGGFLFGAVLSVPLRMREDGRREYRLEDAEAAFAAGDLNRAADYYRQYLSEKQDDANAHHALARVCACLRQNEAAYRHYRDALRLYLNRANFGAAARVYEEAAAGFDSFPLPPALLQRVASALEETREYPLALRVLGELCREYPDAKEAELSLLRMAKLHLLKLGQPQNALAILGEFLRQYPKSEWHKHAQQLLADAETASAGLPTPPTPGPTLRAR